MNELLREVLSKGVITADDIKQLSTMELLVVIIRRVNECHDLTVEQIERVNQLLSGGLKDEVVATLDKWKADGTLTQIIDEEIIGNVNDKLVNPEQFRTDNQSDTEVIQLAIDYCSTHNRELHLYQDYEVLNMVINKPLIIRGHGNTIKATQVIDNLIEINGNIKVYIDHLTVDANLVAKKGIFINGGEAKVEYVSVHNATETNVLVKKVGSNGVLECYELYLYNAPVGLNLSSTDNKIRRVTSFDCNEHLIIAGGGSFVDDFHGWNWNRVANSSLITVKLGGGGSLHLSNIYADTVETAIKLAETSQYTQISGSVISYFLNRSKYPDGNTLSSPKLVRGLGNYKGKMVLTGVVVDTSAWKDGNGNMSEIFDAPVPHSRVQVFGLCNNGMVDSSHINRVGGDIPTSKILEEQTNYYGPYTRKYIIEKDDIHFRIEASMKMSLPNATRVYQIQLAEPFNMGRNVEATAYVQNDNGSYVLGVSVTSGNTLSVYNNTGQTISSGTLQVNVHIVKY